MWLCVGVLRVWTLFLMRLLETFSFLISGYSTRAHPKYSWVDYQFTWRNGGGFISSETPICTWYLWGYFSVQVADASGFINSLVIFWYYLGLAQYILCHIRSIYFKEYFFLINIKFNLDIWYFLTGITNHILIFKNMSKNIFSFMFINA